MKKKQSGSLREWFFVSMIVLVVFVLVFGGIEGKRQDWKNLDDFIKFQKAEEYYNQGNFDEAYPLYLELLQKQKHQESVSLNWGMAQIMKDRSQYDEAVEYYDRIREHFPAIVHNQVYLEEYIGALTLAGDKRVDLYRK